MQINGAVALVTGSSRGIGAALARLLAGAGATVIPHGSLGAEQVADELGVRGLAADLTEAGAPAELYQQARALHGRLDLLVHSAGVGHYGDLASTPAAEIDRLLDINLRACMHLTRLALPDMLQAGAGHLCFIASIAGLVGVRHEAVYAATKAGVVGFADSIRLEVGGRGIGVSTICPGAVDTEFFLRRGANYDRGHPQPITAEAVAAKAMRAIERDQARSVVPRWLAVAPAMKALLPGIYEPLARRFG
ncbi:SDR family NAD(P)-dependent oxidoreductase [Jatrophihabitans sp. DSM 45814]